MINLNLLTIGEYKPVHGQSVTIFTADRAWSPIIGIEPKYMKCEVHFQMYDADDDCPCMTSCGFDPETQADIPFDVPIRFKTEPIPGKDRLEKIVGWYALSDKAMDLIKNHPDYEEGFYYKKEFFFVGSGDYQIHQSDHGNEVLGIIDTKYLNDQLMENLNA